MEWVTIACLCFAVAAALLFGLESVNPKHNEARHWEEHVSSVGAGDGLRFRLMTFNIRYGDGNEGIPRHNWEHRRQRVVREILNWQPAVVGMQEVLRNQLFDMMDSLSAAPQGGPQYAAVVQNGVLEPSSVNADRENIRLHDAAIAILFRSDLLELQEQATVRLPITAEVETSCRKVMVVRFRFRNDGTSEVIMFNTHLHSGSELARRNQSAGLVEVVREWRARYPQAFLFMNGDFNSVPGHHLHATIQQQTELTDAWLRAKTRRDSAHITFHGWWGERANRPVARLAQGLLFTFRAVGLDLDHRRNFSATRMLRFAQQLVWPPFPWRSALSTNVISGQRLHVDWILADKRVGVAWATVGDIRNQHFASDHFPLIAEFTL